MLAEGRRSHRLLIVDDDLGLLWFLIDELIGARHQLIKLEANQPEGTSDW